MPISNSYRMAHTSQEEGDNPAKSLLRFATDGQNDSHTMLPAQLEPKQAP